VRVALSGTPGTGKTTASELLDVPVVHLNDVVESEELWTDRDEERDSLVADVEALADWLDRNEPAGEPVVVESHLAHLFDADRVVVLRCRPDELEARLRERGVPADKAVENAESEALDVILAEAVERHGADGVHEIDTTGRDPDAVAADVRAVVAGEREPSVGDVAFDDYL
jgi:adenylate kinase